MKKISKIFVAVVLAAVVLAGSVSAYEIFIDMGDFDFPELIEMDGSISSRVMQFPDVPEEERGTFSYDITFNSTRAGTFYAWARIYHEHAADNSFFYIDRNGEEQIFDGFEPWAGSHFEDYGYTEFDISERWYNQFYWHPIGPRDEDNIPWRIRDTFYVVEGQNTFVVLNREPNFIVDMIIFTDNPDFDPIGMSVEQVRELIAEDEAARAEEAVDILEEPVANEEVPEIVVTPAPETSDFLFFNITVIVILITGVAYIISRKKAVVK